MANAAAPIQTSTTTRNIDPAHSIAEFKVKHMMIANVKGQFSKVASDLASNVIDHIGILHENVNSPAKRKPSRVPSQL